MNSSPTDGERPNENSVLDASALLAVILSEPGGDVARAFIRSGAVMSTVNLGEVLSRLTDLGMEPQRARSEVEAFPLTYHAFTSSMAWTAGLLRSSTRHLGLSLGDRACLALAASLGLPAVTADRLWAQLDVGVQIEVVR